MFDSANYLGSNLLFKDSTIELVAAGDKDTYQKWLGEEYYNAVKALDVNCEVNSSQKVFFSPLLFVLMAVIKYFFN